MAAFDVIVKGGRWFDGTGAPSAIRNLGIREGRVVTVSADPLDETDCPRVIDAAGHWVLPGMVDIHTHYDVEVLVQPGLTESLRHGITTTFLGSCSLSTVHASPSDAGDLFGRVEAIPRPFVVDALERLGQWTTSGEYVAALEQLPLGPNVAAFIGHSDIRAARMGLERATDPAVRPTATELAQMEADLVDALDEGFVGLSSQELMFDKLDGEVCRSRTLPSTYAKGKERRRLHRVLRARDRALQGGPDVAKPQSLARMAFSSCGWGRKPALKVSLLSAADIKAIPMVAHLFPLISRTVNRFGGNLRFQHLPVPFEVYSDGIALPVFEEFGSGAAALHMSNRIEEQRSLLADDEYRRWFRKDYEKKYGPRLLRRVRDAEAAGTPFMTIEHAVHRITGELGDWYGIEAGHLREGDRADLVVIDPERLDASLDAYAEAPVPAFGNLSRMVNRNDATVAAVLVGGEVVVENGAPAADVGVRRTGQFLRVG